MKSIQIFLSGFVPALATTSHCPVSNQTSTHESILDSFFSPLLMAVPRNRRTVEKRRMRRFANTWFDQTKLKKNIIVCLNCGHHHESDTICGGYKFIDLCIGPIIDDPTVPS